MKPIRAPFGTGSRGPAAIWPEFSGPSTSPSRYDRPREVWEQASQNEVFTGERVLADLDADMDADDALILLARYLTVRAAVHADRGTPPGESVALDADAARQYLAELDGHAQESRWLSAVLDAVGRPNRFSHSVISRLNAAATAAANIGHTHGAFALHVTAYEIATRRGWFLEAARVAASIAASAGRGGGRYSQRLWSRRAAVHRKRAEAV